MAPDRITDEWITERLDALWPAHNASFARLLVALRKQFDGDLDAMLVLLVVSLGTSRTNWQQSLMGEWSPGAQLTSTNTQSIADATGIPRESVRRKLERLRGKGWVERQESGYWAPTLRAAEDLRPSTLETIAYLRSVISAGVASHDD
jgi:hypothetical protein